MTARRFQKINHVLNRRQPDLTVVMDNVNKLHNLAAIVRTCDAVGVGDVWAVADSDDIRVKQKAASGTGKWVNVHAGDSIDKVYAHLRQQGVRLLAAHFDAQAAHFRDVDYTRPIAIVVGAELYGVSARAVELADGAIRIPMAGMVQSLNVSVATALILFEAQRQREAAGFYDDRPRLAPDEVKRMRFEWMHPRVARYCREKQIAYPRMDENGQICEPLTD